MTRFLAALQARIYASHRRRTIRSNAKHYPTDKAAVTTRRQP